MVQVNFGVFHLGFHSFSSGMNVPTIRKRIGEIKELIVKVEFFTVAKVKFSYFLGNLDQGILVREKRW